MVKFISKAVIFSFLFWGVVYILDPLFLDRDQWVYSSYNSLYEAEGPKNLVFIGNSHLNKGLDNFIVDARTGSESIKLVGAGLNIAQIYYNFLEVLEHESPELVVMETWCLYSPGDNHNNPIDDKGKLGGYNKYAFENKRVGPIKFEETRLSVDKKEVPFHLFNTFRYHDRWTDIEGFADHMDDRYSGSGNENLHKTVKSGGVLPRFKAKKYADTNFDSSEILLSNQEKEYLSKILKLSEKKGIKLLFLNIPIFKTYYQKNKKAFDRVSKELTEFFESHENVKFFDLNGDVGGFSRTFMSNERNISANQHVNYKGCIKTSNLVSDYLIKNYDLRVNDNPFSSEEDILYNFKKIEKDSLFLGGINKVNETLVSKMKNRNRIIINAKEDKIRIEGWMFREGINNIRSEKKIALRKGNKFIYISGNEMKERKAYALINKFGEQYAKSGYRFEIPSEAIEKGRYRIYHLIKSNNGDLYVQDTWKRLVVR